ncbi:hypothetical protein ACJMK2_017040 [Sinanodonta woodiana]|uniref:Sterile alpha motif domain-containing protein 9-like n=1 Tax=Sinanodonta woodiana TaxID=1069815 RepID=A0ABD3UVM1_SINWO
MATGGPDEASQNATFEMDKSGSPLHIYFNQCQGIQVGPNNLMVIEEAKKGLNQGPKEIGMTKNDMVVAMLKSILNPKLQECPPPMPLRTLEEKFRDTFAKLQSSNMSFKDIAGLPFQQFLEKNKDHFNIQKKKKKGAHTEVVRIVNRKPKGKKSKNSASVPMLQSDKVHDDHKGTKLESAIGMDLSRKNVLSDIKVQSLEEEDIPSVSTPYFSCEEEETVAEDEQSDCYSGLSDPQSYPLIEQSGNCGEWETVTKAKKKDVTVVENRNVTSVQVSKANRICYSEVVKGRANTEKINVETLVSELRGHKKSKDVCLFEGLINKTEGRDLIFYPDDDLCQSNPCKLMLDIVSMWNTPNRFRSHIVLGVTSNLTPPHSLNGLKLNLKDKDYQQLFKGNEFTSRPMFHYTEVPYSKRSFGIIEVQSSYGYGQPSIVKSSNETAGVSLQAEQLWYRPCNENRVCKASDPYMMSVYQWFIGKDGKRMESFSTAHKPELENSNFETDIEESIPVKREGKTVTYFMDCVGKFKNGHYILISGDVQGATTNLEGLAHVPWIAVYDFDINSRDKGLLCTCQDVIDKKRFLSITTWNRPSGGISDSGTLWCFMRGARDISDTRTDNPSKEKVEDVKHWYTKVKHGLEGHCRQLARFVEGYTVLTAVVLWPQDEKLIPIMQKFIDQLDNQMEFSMNIVVCITQALKTEQAGSILNYMKAMHENNLFICWVDLEKMCLAILNERSICEEQHMKHQLPAGSNQNIDINEKDAVWLREDMHVLYYKSEFAKTKCEVSVLDEEADKFYKGGTLHWFAWYNCGMGHFDIERDLLKEITKKIKYLTTESCRAAVIKIFHAPGSGGTTLGQRILWTFHEQTPCVHLKLHTASTVQDVISKIEFIHEQTHLPVLVLIDGEDESKVKHVAKCCTAFGTIIIYLKRYPYPVKFNQRGETFYLRGEVSSEEATLLALKFGERCEGNESKKSTLRRFSKEVSNGEVHYLYEFGMATYFHEFKGIQSYVKGYLQLEDNPTKELLSWQKILGFLSLAYYYGQTSLSCQIFAALLSKPANYCISLDDFPHPVQQFVVPDINEGRTKLIRICHYYVAQEILEQLLNRIPNSKRNVTGCSELSTNARQNLEKFCLDFIEYVSRKKTKNSVQSSTIIHILTRIFIYRDNRDMGENEEQHRKKPKLSKLMIDIASKPPLFTERLHVLEKLTTSFPEDPNFHAHLGRFYSYCRPDGEVEAEKCFQKALSLSEEIQNYKQDEEVDERMSLTLMHIYHMYGMIYQKRIAKFTGRSPKEEPEVKTEYTSFQKQLEELVSYADKACSLFRQSRENTPIGQETCLAYTGELQVRLQICDFVHRFCRKRDPEDNLQNIIEAIEDDSTREFISTSISLIDNLILECFDSLEPGEIDHSLHQVIFWYNYLFKPRAKLLEKMQCEEDVFSRRLKIAAKKLKYSSKDESLSVLESITSPEDIADIVHLFEENFKHVTTYGLQTSGKKALEQDYREWLIAIRHELFAKEYDVEEVLLHVQQWNDLVSSPLSKFYLFVLKSLSGFGSCNAHGSTANLVDAQILKEEMMKMSRYIIRPRHPREWLGKDRNGNGKSIKQLIPGNRFHVGWIEDRDREVKVPALQDVKICKGTICQPNKKKLSGFIDLDLGDNTVPVKVFFIPHVAKLEGSRFSGHRVEFQLGFSIEHGYEAFNVKQLSKYGCSKCTAKVEILSTEDTVKCSNCRTPVHRTELNSTSD